MIEIKDIQGNVRASVPVNVDSKLKFLLMQEDYILIKFSTAEPIHFRLGDYVDYSVEIGTETKHYKRYELCDLATLTPNVSTGGYDYELRFDSYYWKWKNKKFKYFVDNAEGGKEAAWDITATPDIIMGVFLRNLAHYGYKYYGDNSDFIVDITTLENAAESKLVSFNNTNLIDALNLIAETWECEWWITENIIHFGKCEFGDTYVPLFDEPFTDESGVVHSANVAEMKQSNSRNTYVTRIFAFGSTRNIPTNYRPTTTEDTVNAVVQKRLMLPEDIPYVDAYRYDSNGNRVYIGESGYDAATEMPIEEAVEDVMQFDDVYPRRDDKIVEIRTDEITDKAENEDGSIIEEKWTRYRIKLASSSDTNKWFKKEYLLDTAALRISFEDGLLNGMDFDVEFNPYNAGESQEASQWYEIVRNEEYGRNLPDNILAPQVGDTVVLYNWNVSLMLDDGLGYINDAEQELYEETVKAVKDLVIDANNYTCMMMSNVMLGYDLKTHKVNPDDALSLEIGQRVELINKAFFESGSRKSRIIGIEANFDYIWDNPVYTIGETAAIGRLKEIESNIESIKRSGKSIVPAGKNNSVYVIGANDRTKATDTNVYSALRSDRQFAAKDKTEIIEGIWQFVNYLQSRNFVPGTLGTGWWFGNEDGKSYLEVDKIYVRLKAIFDTLEIKHVEHVGGEFILSPAGATIKSVKEAFANAVKFFAVEAVVTTSFGSDETIEPTRVVFDTITKQFVGVYIKSGVIKPTYYLTFKGSEKYGVEGEYYEDAEGVFYQYKDGELTVAETRNAYRCYFTVEDEDATIYNQFKVDDLVFCKTFNLGANEEVAATSQRYYWRKCVGVGKDYIDLSMSHCDTDSDIPEAGDAVVTLGNISDTDRQNAVVISSYGTFAPSIIMYKGIDSYSLEGKAEIQISPSGNKFTGEFIVQTADGEKHSLVEFLNDRISLHVHSSLYDEECAIVTSPDICQSSEDYIIDLNENCLTWRPGDKIAVQLSVRIGNVAEPNVRLLTEEATAGVFKTWDWSQQLYNPSGEDFEGVLTAEIEIEDIVRNWDYYSGAYLVFECNSQYDLDGVSVKKISMQSELRDTGIDIEDGTITLNAEKTTIQDGDTMIAMFEVNEDGTPKLAASLIDAERIDVTKLNTKPLKQPHISIEGQQIQLKEADTDTKEGETKILIHGGKLSEASETLTELKYQGLSANFGEVYGENTGLINTPDSEYYIDEGVDRTYKSAIVPVSVESLDVTSASTIFTYSPIVGQPNITIRTPKKDANGQITEPIGGTARISLRRYYHPTKKDFKLSEAQDYVELGGESYTWDEKYTGTKTFPSKTFSIPSGTLPVGHYRFAVHFTTTALVESGILLVGGSVGSNNITGVVPTMLQEIALDGFNFRYKSDANSNKIAYVKSTEDGFEVRNGDYGIRISGNAEHPGAVYTNNGFIDTYPFGTSENPTVSYPNIGATATVDDATGIPSVNVTKSGSGESQTFTFAFSGLKGEKGADGAKGEKGDTGADGTSISEIATTYQASDKGTAVPTGEWLTTPEAAKGKYLWSRMAIQLSTGAVRYHYTVAYQGEDATGDVPTPIFGTFVDGISADFIDWLNSTIATDFSKVVYISNLKMFAVKSSSRYCVKFTASGGVTQEDYQKVDSDAKTAAVHKDKTYVRVDTDELYLYNDAMGLTQVNKKIKIQ